jgi:hypothetical protein
MWIKIFCNKFILKYINGNKFGTTEKKFSYNKRYKRKSNKYIYNFGGSFIKFEKNLL